MIVGGGEEACNCFRWLSRFNYSAPITIIAPSVSEELQSLSSLRQNTVIYKKTYSATDIEDAHFVIASTGDDDLDLQIKKDATQKQVLVFIPGHPQLSDIVLSEDSFVTGADQEVQRSTKFWLQRNNEIGWKRLATKFVIAFVLMVLGHLIISHLPLPSVPQIWTDVQPYFDKQFLFFVLAGFLAQMVDGMLSMGYGVTSATCLISFGVHPVAVSASIHTAEVFASGISGYSHYKFGNVNKKLFRHLVIPGVIGAVLGAIALVLFGEQSGKWLMPVMALYAMFLGFKILRKAFQKHVPNKKVKRLGWLAGAGGFLDSFGGGGWGPIVTSSLIAKGRSPKYTIGSVSLTEFFVTLASALTFFIAIGVSHINIVLGLLIGGMIAAPFAAKLAGKLSRKTMMIAVGVMVMVWCIRMIIKSIT